MKPMKLDFIDSLRGIAAVYVALYHLGHMTGSVKIVPDWLVPVTNAGGTGVMLFFVLSAFTLCLSMDQRKADESKPVINYFIRRFFRIAPLFYAFIIITIIRDKVCFDTWHSPWEIVKSVLFIFNIPPGSEQGFVWASWTIGVEMLFYVVFPFFYRVADNLGKSVALFIAAITFRMVWNTFVMRAIPDPGVASVYYQMSFLHHIPTFLVGIIAYHLYKTIKFESARALGLGYALIVTSLASYIGGMIYGGFSFAAFGDQTTVQAFIFASLLIGLSISDSKIIVNRVTQILGKVSYSFYLSHSTILFLIAPTIMLIGNKTGNGLISYLAISSASVLLIAAFSYLTYRFIEIPGNHAGKWVIRRLAEKKRPEGLLHSE